MRRRSLLAALLVLLAQTVGATVASAALPPPPPAPPDCKTCIGPPPPPTPLPTAAPALLPSQPSVDVHLAPTHVSRGHAAKVQVQAPQDATVSVGVRYKGTKAYKVFHTKVGSSGTAVQAWTIPKNAPLGTAQVKVAVSGTGAPFTLSLIVTR
jgi:hypothetical protein